MARSRAPSGGGSLALLGAASPSGVRVKAALAERGVPGERVSLYGRQRDVAVLSDYDGEARLVQPAEEFVAASHVAVFVCEPATEPARLLEAADRGTLVVDLTGTIAPSTFADAEAVRDGARLVAVAHPAASMLAAVLGPLHATCGLARVSAFVLRPAGDFGEAGLEELREQVVHLLRFEPVPQRVFGRQIAFNVVPEHLLPEGEGAASARMVGEIRALLGAADLPLTVSAALVPAFLGHAASLHVDVARGGLAEALEALAAAAGVIVDREGEAGTTVDAPEDAGVVVARCDEAAPGMLTMWAAAADAGAAPAASAIEAADAAGVL